MRVMIEVTAVHKDAMGTRIEGAIIHGVVEDEDDEGESASDDDDDEGDE